MSTTSRCKQMVPVITHFQVTYDYIVHIVVHVYTSTVPSSPIWEGHHRTGWTAMSVVLVHRTRGGWSHYYMHGAAPITQYMATSTQFNPMSQQIIIMYEQNYTYSHHQKCALDNNSIT